MAAEAFGVAASALAVVELSAKVVMICAQYTKAVANARQDIERLQKEVENLGSVAESVRDLSENTPQHKVTTIEKVQSILEEGRMRLAELQAKLDHGKGGRHMSRIGLHALKWPFSSKDVEKALRDLARLTQAISLAMQVDHTTLLLSLEQKTTLERLPIAEGAAFDSYADEHNSQCLGNTRAAVLHDIVEWIHDPSLKAVYWLNGMAGTGKSTIARTIANRFSLKDELGGQPVATFFFKRGEGDRGNMSKFLTTITSQLVQQLPEIARHVQAALEADPALTSKALRIQFEKLISYPIAKISSGRPSHRIILFVIDALDECEREKDIQLLIKLFSESARATTGQLKFFLTSRPDLPIRLGFNSVHGNYRDFILHQVAETIIEHDLKVYFRHELERIRLVFNQGLPEERKLPPNWPNAKDVRSLVQMAVPLFIFAATICRFVADRKGGNPEKKLRRVLEFRSAHGSKLMATYMPVLEQLTMDLVPEEQSEILLQFQQIVGSIVVLADPLGSKSLSRLLDVDINEILELLDFLHSVLQVPSMTEQPIRLLHLSFRDFLVDPARQQNPFWIDKRKTHQNLAEKCLQVLNTSLKNDICNVQAPGTLTSSIPASRIRKSIPAELQYACRFWAYHLHESSSSDLDTAEIWRFLRSHFLQWLEVLSWMGRLPESFGVVTTLQSVSHIEKNHEMTEFLKDSERFLQTASLSIQMAPLQAYCSSLAFTPSQSIVRRMYEGDLINYIALGPRMPAFWDDCAQTFEVYSKFHYTIKQTAFSSDGKPLVVASGWTKVILLAADTGEHRMQLQVPEASSLTSAFSPDGKSLGLVTETRKVTLWHTETGNPQQTLNGHNEAVIKLVFSPDSKFLASMSLDGVVILWTVSTGERWQTFKTPPVSIQETERWGDHSFQPLAISPNNELLAQMVLDHSIIIWELESGRCRKILKGCFIRIGLVKFSSNSRLLMSMASRRTIIWNMAESQRLFDMYTDEVACSLDNGLLAAATSDGTVTLWHIHTGQQQHLLKGSGHGVEYIAFSPNGKLLALADRYGIVFLWAAETGELLRIFDDGSNRGLHYSKSVLCVLFSPDSKRLLTASACGSISIWALDAVECGQMPKKHTQSVKFMMFSPDSKLLVSASANGSVMLWRADNGEHKQTLEGDSPKIKAIAFSPDSKLLASAIIDQTVGLWTADTGVRWRTLRGQTDSVHKVVFSPDGKMLATISSDQTVVLWFTDTGTRRKTLEGHSDWITSIAFSPDGKILATASHDQTVALWDTETGVCWQTLEGHSAGIKSIAFSPNGRMLASASYDQTVALWATDTGERLRILNGYSPTEWSEIVFSCDRKLVVSDSGRAMVLWETESNEGQQTPFGIGHSDSSMKFDRSVSRTAVVRSSSVLAFPPGPYRLETIGASISQDKAWICFNGEPILWLPLEYRYRSVVSGDTIAIGCESGQVLIVRLRNPFVIRSSVESSPDDEA